MAIKQAYNQLLEKDRNLDLLSEVYELRTYCENEGNDEYFFLCTNLIIDIFIEESLLDDALKLALMSLDELEKSKDQYKEIYLKLLNDLAYIYITNQNYKRALEVEHMKKEYLNSDDKNEVNRWLLECSYIHEAIGEKNDALMKLNAVVSNDPTDEIKSVALSNIIKLYIDANDLVYAKEKLDECIKLVNDIKDIEGIRYCEYLQGKILRLEKQYKSSYVVLNKLVKSIEQLNQENFNYINEFITLLIDMNSIQEGLELALKYYDVVSKSFDLEDKLIFYKLCLRLDLASNKKKKGFFDSINLFDQISNLEKEILTNKNIQTSELRENDLIIESENSAKAITKKMIEGLEKIEFKNKSSIRDYLIKYSNSLVNVVPMDEIQYLIFDKSVSTVLPVLPTNVDMISLYQYKNNRLYERKISYKNIERSVVEKIIEDQKAFSCDLSKPSNSFNDVITLDNYSYNYLLAIPLFNDEGLFGCILHLSKSNFLLENFSSSFIKTATVAFEAHLINLLFKLNNKLENDLLSTATNNLNYGLFYYNDYSKKLILSDNLSKLLNLSTEVNINEYNELILQSDLDDYSKKYQLINEKNNYNITYHVNINDESVLFKEQASPIEINNTLYYVGTIDKVIITDAIKEINKDKLLDLNDLKKSLDSKKDKSFNGLTIKTNLNNLKINEKDQYLFKLSKDLKDLFKLPIYLIDDLFVVLFDKEKALDILKKVKSNILKKYDCKYTLLQYPKQLVRIDDFIGLTKYLVNLNQNVNEIEFSNELYANYISVNTINSCVNKAIVSENVELLAQHVTSNSQLVGYYVTPNIMGVYNSNVLKVIDKDLQNRLDEYMINCLENKDFISVYSINLDSLLNICTYKNIKEDAKIVFEINDFSDPFAINLVIEKLKNTKSRLIISNELLKVISINNLINHGDIILGFNEIIDENYLNFSKDYINYNLFNNDNGLKVSKVTYKLSEIKN